MIPVPPTRHIRQCFGCGPANPESLGIALVALPEGAEGRVCFGSDHQGAPGLVHGGLLATLLDEVMGFVQHAGDAVRVTAEMTVRYRRPVPVGTDLVCRARVVDTTGRRLTMHAAITAAGDPERVLAEADATYVVLEPRPGPGREPAPEPGITDAS